MFLHRYNNNDDEDRPLHELQFYYSDIKSNRGNYTRYDGLLAGSSDDARVQQWWLWGSFSLFMASISISALLAIVRKPSLRNKPFNLYVVFLLIPDQVFSIFCGINCMLNAANGEYISSGWCQFQAVYLVWGIGGNSWLNAAVSRHLHSMLVCNSRRERYFAPTIWHVVMECLAIYIWLAFVASWVFWDILPQRIGLRYGLGCLPTEYNLASTLFTWLVFMPCWALVPIGFAMFVAADVYRRKLLPAGGRGRELAIYYFRIVAYFLLTWFPSIIFIFAAAGNTDPWVAVASGVYSHLQTGVSAVVSLLKSDIWESYVEMMTCGLKTNAKLPGTKLSVTRTSHNSTTVNESNAALPIVHITGIEQSFTMNNKQEVEEGQEHHDNLAEDDDSLMPQITMQRNSSAISIASQQRSRGVGFQDSEAPSLMNSPPPEVFEQEPVEEKKLSTTTSQLALAEADGSNNET